MSGLAYVITSLSEHGYTVQFSCAGEFGMMCQLVKGHRSISHGIRCDQLKQDAETAIADELVALAWRFEQTKEVRTHFGTFTALRFPFLHSTNSPAS